MEYYSLNNKAPKVSYKDAVINGIAPDKGLYFPEEISPLPKQFWDSLESMDDKDIAFQTIHQFVSADLPDDVLKSIIAETLNFDFPIVQLSDTISTLELFHGPTMAFKDVGAKFMAGCLGYFSKESNDKVTVLVATSGDTGGAVANGFLGTENVNVVILYPSGKVSDIQERQLTTLGNNIKALEVNGVFDDCQDMVKQAFLDAELTNKLKLTSANSINIARWLPQMFYFIFAYKTLKHRFKEIVFSVPSGNFGNICAGLMARKLGMPVNHFIASNNANDVVTNYLNTGEYRTKASIQTISNAMDVGNPSNFIRIQRLFQDNLTTLKHHLHAYSFNDSETREAVKELYSDYNYIGDPHGAVGYLGAKEYLKRYKDQHCVFLETAHPTKFLDVVEDIIGISLELPAQIKSVMNSPKKSIKIDSYTDLKSELLG